MSADKCPKCGAELVWIKSSPMHAYCPDGCFETERKDAGPEDVVPAMLHRIRELEAQNARLTEALMRVQEMAHNASSGPMEPDTYWDIRAMAQEALK